MIRTFKPPPRVNPHAAVHGREEDDYYKDGHTANPKVDNIIEFDFEAAVAEEMRKLEEDFRQKAPAAYVAADFVDRNPPKDLFEAPYHESEAPYKISITNDARAGLFESHVNAAVSELGQNIASPGRRKGRAISNLHGDQDNRLNLKAAKAAEYANYLQNQVRTTSIIILLNYRIDCDLALTSLYLRLTRRKRQSEGRSCSSWLRQRPLRTTTATISPLAGRRPNMNMATLLVVRFN